MSSSAEDIHRRTDSIYRTISEQFNPNLKTFILCGRAYEKALAGVSQAARHYYDAMNKLGIVASDSPSTKDLGESLRQMAQSLELIQLHHDDTVKFLNQEILFPLENKLENDQKYMVGVHKKYQTDFRARCEELDKASMNHKKVKRKSYSGRKTYKYDEKEKQLLDAVAQKQRQLDRFQFDSLGQAFLEERRRFCFFAEQQCELAKRTAVFHQKALETITDHLPKWLDSCADVRSLPDHAADLLELVRPDDSSSISSIPEPPNEPAAQINGTTYDSAMIRANIAAINGGGYDDVDQRPVNTTGHNVIPRESRKKVVAVFNHSVPGSPTQLSFEKDDVIILMIPQPRDGWHYGENDRTKLRGWFPYSYTKLMEQYSVPETSKEPIHGHMPLPPPDYDVSPDTQRNGNGPNYYASHHNPGNPFANVQLRKTENGEASKIEGFSSFRS